MAIAKLVQWALAYLAGAWLVIQVVDVFADQFLWPLGLQRGVSAALAVGFFAALVVAWHHGERGASASEVWRCVKNAKGKLVTQTPKVHLKSRLTHLGKGKKINNSMAKVVKRGLKYHRTSAMRAISVKSMPESVEGSFGRYSILYWDKVTFTWCYVTGETEEAMFEMGNNIKLTKRVPYDPARKWVGRGKEISVPKLRQPRSIFLISITRV